MSKHLQDGGGSYFIGKVNGGMFMRGIMYFKDILRVLL